MASTFTTNKSIEKPANGDYVNTWNVPVNADWDIVDKALGGTTTLNVTGVTSTPVNLTATQYQALILNITGTLTANVTYTIPSGVGGQWIIPNNTTGSFTVTITNLGGGSSYIVPQGYRALVASDGTNIVLSTNLPSTPAGSTTQVQYNSSGSTAGSANFTFDGTNVVISGNITGASYIDNIGNVRIVPSNTQTSAYTLAATDAGKYVNITTGGITVPSGIFSNGQTITIYNNSSATQTITAAPGVTVTLAGVGTTNTNNLALNGLATLLCVGSNLFVITGAGVS